MFLYYKNAAADSAWENLANWFWDYDGTLPASVDHPEDIYRPSLNAPPWTAHDATQYYDLAMTEAAEVANESIMISVEIASGSDITGTCGLRNLHNNSTIFGGTFSGENLTNNSTINGGTFSVDSFYNGGTINGGIFSGASFDGGGTINGGIFSVDHYNGSGPIFGGIFSVAAFTNTGTIYGGNWLERGQLDVALLALDSTYGVYLVYGYHRLTGRSENPVPYQNNNIGFMTLRIPGQDVLGTGLL